MAQPSAEFRLNFHEIMKERGLTARELASRIGCRYPTVCSLSLKGASVKRLDSQTIALMCNGLGVSLADAVVLYLGGSAVGEILEEPRQKRRPRGTLVQKVKANA